MFIKRDHRKIPEILSSDSNEVLYLSKRAAEFNGSFSNSALYWNKNKHIKNDDNDMDMNDDNDDNVSTNPLINLKRLNLYDNRLQDLEGFNALLDSPLIELNIGNNCLKELPQDFNVLKKLQMLYMEDNYFEEFPDVICDLVTLNELRISQNHIKIIPFEISLLVNLVTLAIDNNDLDDFPDGICELPNLKHLWLRQNKISYIPENIEHLISLETLSLSSNMIRILPSQVTSLTQLKHIYVNSNMIDVVPSDLPTMPNLINVNIANNELGHIPYDWEVAWGTFDDKSDILSHTDKTNNVTVTISGNPLSKSSNQINSTMDVENTANSNVTKNNTIFELLDDTNV